MNISYKNMKFYEIFLKIGNIKKIFRKFQKKKQEILRVFPQNMKISQKYKKNFITEMRRF